MRKNRYIKTLLISIVLCGLTLFGFGGCKKQPVAISGGTVDKTDYDAPKVIESKDITEFSTRFFLIEGLDGEVVNRRFQFEIKNNENGELTVFETESGASVPANSELLASVQNVIDNNDLVSKNGIYRITAGLAPEYQEGFLNAAYASGETLSFTENNDPYAQWAKEMYAVFADWFENNGDSSLKTN